jgi:carbamoyltransferase
MSLKFKESLNNPQKIIIGLNSGHEGSACVFIDDELAFLAEEERYAKEKYCTKPHLCVSKIIEYFQNNIFNPSVLHFCTSFPYFGDTEQRSLNTADAKGLPSRIGANIFRNKTINKSKSKDILVESYADNHHTVHTLGALARSGFDEALVIVSDGIGSKNPENLTINFRESAEKYGIRIYTATDEHGKIINDDDGLPLIVDRSGHSNVSLGGAEIFTVSAVKFNIRDELIYPIVFKRFKGGTNSNASDTFKKINQYHIAEYLESIKNKKFNVQKLISCCSSPGDTYQSMAEQFYGFDAYSSGKIMGLSSYGKYNPDIKYIYDSDGFYNEEIMDYIHKTSITQIPDVPWEDLYVLQNILTVRRYPVELVCPDYYKPATEEWHTNPEKTPQLYKDFAYMLQKNCQEIMYKQIKTYLEYTGLKKLVLTGGFFHNVVANYYIRKKLNEDFGPGKIKMFADPLCHDSGNAHGSAILSMVNSGHFTKKNHKQFKLNTLYLGYDHKTTEQDLQRSIDYYDSLDKDGSFEVNDTTYEEVASLIKNNNIVSLFQGRSEIGPRALGNRSILYNPTDPNGRNKVNTVKRREWFRPFAASVLYEHVDEWFDMASLDESPFMMYAVDTLEEMIEEIPAVVHVDGTCRLQTVKREQNENYYKLIEEFYKQTEIPMVLNTSFNVAGDTMVETIDDAIQTLCRSKIEYLFLPEFMKLVKCTKYFYEDE